MRPINLIPEDERRRDGVAAKPSLMGWAVIALLALVVVGAGAYALTANSLSSSERELAELQSTVMPSYSSAQPSWRPT